MLNELMRDYEDAIKKKKDEVSEKWAEALMARSDAQTLERMAKEAREKESRLVREAENVKRADWCDLVVRRLAENLAEYVNMKCFVYGPQGIGCRVVIQLAEDGDMYPFMHKTKRIIVRPDFTEGRLTLMYETGAKNENHPAGSLGAESGLNNEVAPLPDTLNEILALMKDVPPNNF